MSSTRQKLPKSSILSVHSCAGLSRQRSHRSSAKSTTDSKTALASFLAVHAPAASFKPPNPGPSASPPSVLRNVPVDRAKLGTEQPVVFDNVFSPLACDYLHSASSLGELGNESHTLFERSAKARTALETCLHSMLTELGDTSPYVEYWFRDIWIHVEAHEDVDEDLFARDNVTRRYPKNAHVLYLKVDEPVRGPTCVWARTADKLRRRGEFGSLTTVPAREGRLLRFDGKLMHTVPCPADLFLPAELRDPDAPGACDEDQLVRGVVLFNTWDDPPLGVGRADVADPLEVVQKLAGDLRTPHLDAILELMANPPDACCQPFDQWVRARERRLTHSKPMLAKGARPLMMSVELLGEAPRRGQHELEFKFEAPLGLLRALHEHDLVTYFEAM